MKRIENSEKKIRSLVFNMSLSMQNFYFIGQLMNEKSFEYRKLNINYFFPGHINIQLKSPAGAYFLLFFILNGCTFFRYFNHFVDDSLIVCGKIRVNVDKSNF